MNNIRIEFNRILAQWWELFRKKNKIVIVFTVLGIGFGVGAFFLQSPIYEANEWIEIERIAQKANFEYDSYISLMQSESVIHPVIEKLHQGVSRNTFLKDHLRIERVAGTGFVKVTGISSSPDDAQMIANDVVENFRREVYNRQSEKSQKEISETIKNQQNVYENSRTITEAYAKEHNINAVDYEQELIQVMSNRNISFLTDYKLENELAMVAQKKIDGMMFLEENIKDELTYEQVEYLKLKIDEICQKEVLAVLTHYGENMQIKRALGLTENIKILTPADSAVVGTSISALHYVLAGALSGLGISIVILIFLYKRVS